MGHYFTNDFLASNIQKFHLELFNQSFTFMTDNGVFSKKELDFGTYLLLKNVVKLNITGDVLDLGCGYGPIGIVLSKLFPIKLTMIDINRRAIHLTKMNIKENKLTNIVALVSDGYREIGDQKFDYIISNPPIRIGKKALYDLLISSHEHLKSDGEMLIVVRKEQGAVSLIKDMSVYYSVKVIDKDKGFLIISLK